MILGSPALSDNGRLSLTTFSLTVLHHGFTQLSAENLTQSFEVVSQNAVPSPTTDSLTFLNDFLQKTNTLKVHTQNIEKNIAGFVKFHYIVAQEY